MFDSPSRLPLAMLCGKFGAIMESLVCRRTGGVQGFQNMPEGHDSDAVFARGTADGDAALAVPVPISWYPAPRSLRQPLETMT
jgi:hypothetical protein